MEAGESKVMKISTDFKPRTTCPPTTGPLDANHLLYIMQSLYQNVCEIYLLQFILLRCIYHTQNAMLKADHFSAFVHWHSPSNFLFFFPCSLFLYLAILYYLPVWIYIYIRNVKIENSLTPTKSSEWMNQYLPEVRHGVYLKVSLELAVSWHKVYLRDSLGCDHIEVYGIR